MSQKISSSQLSSNTWVPAPYTSGWADYDATEWFGVQYIKDVVGRVSLRGLIRNTSGATKPAGNVMFTLPVGHRPLRRSRFVAIGVGASGAIAQQLDVLPNGDVQSPTAAIPNLEWLSFAGISFLSEQ